MLSNMAANANRTFPLKFGGKIIFMRSVNFVINRIPSHCLKETLVT